MPDLNIQGSDNTIKAGKVVCLLRSYKAHADEMGSAPSIKPDFFLKPSSAIVGNGEDIILPMESEEVHHEVELAVVIGKGGKAIAKESAMDHVLGYAILIDVTARDIQAGAKKAGKPWSTAKGYDTFAPMSDIIPKENVPNPHELNIWLKVNGQERQRSNTSFLLFSIEEIIVYISNIMTLEPGDVIATGTPEGVSQIVAGDMIVAGIESVGELRVIVR